MLLLNKVFRYPAKSQPEIKIINGLPNFYHWTHTPGVSGQPQLTSGINLMRKVSTPSGQRRPAILIRSSPYLYGTKSTPWQDRYDLDKGRVRYFGDAKREHMPDPLKPKGNKALLDLRDEHQSPDREVRENSAPLIFFVCPRQGQAKFSGIGVIESAERISQVDANQQPFTNYVFECSILDLKDEGETLNWEWLRERSDKTRLDNETTTYAPEAWKQWVRNGSSALSNVRRNVAKFDISPKQDQLPKPGTYEEKILKQIYDFYSQHGNSYKKRFEALAEIITEYIISEDGNGTYQRGWVTRGSGDQGIDFIGRLDIGNGFGSTSLIVLGQGKCEKIGKATNAVHIARTVARLRRGWLGSYVTTSFFTDNTQREVIDDKYPILLIPGLKVAETIRAITLRDGVSVDEYLKRIDEEYESRLQDREPEQVLSI